MTKPQNPPKRHSPMHTDSVASKVYMAIKAAGREGIVRAKLLELPELMSVSANTVDCQVWALRRRNFIEGAKAPGLPTVFSVTPECAVPLLSPRKGGRPKLAALLAALSDYPGGVSEEVLAEDLDCSPSLLRRCLHGGRALALMDEIALPDSHGGGTGWRLRSFENLPARAEPAQAVAPAQGTTYAAGLVVEQVPAQREAMRLPVVEIDIDAIHRGPAQFACELADDFTLRVSACNVTLTLNPEHTRALLAHIDGKLQAASAERSQEYAG